MDEELIEKAENNDVTGLAEIIAGLSGEAGLRWFLVACEMNSVEFVGAAVALKPELARQRDENGKSAMEVASECGNDRIMMILVHHCHPDMCLGSSSRRNRNSPLHVSVVKGNVPLTKKILEKCPNSVMVENQLNQTALHVAVVTNDRDAEFKLILDEIIRQGKEEAVLHNKDRNGDNILHAAIARKRNQILRWLLVDNLRNRCLMRLNSVNRWGLTAKDIYNCTNGLDSDINQLINQGGATSSTSSSAVLPTTTVTDETINNLLLNKTLLVLSVSALLAASIYTCLFDLSDNTYTTPPDHHHSHILRARVNLLHPERVPEGFFNIVFMTLTFTVSMVTTAFGLCKVVKGWPLCYLTLLGLAAFFLSYASHMGTKVPKFWLAMGSREYSYYTEISSFWLVWLLVMLTILLVLMVWLLATAFIPMFSKTRHRSQRSPTDSHMFELQPRG